MTDKEKYSLGDVVYVSGITTLEQPKKLADGQLSLFETYVYFKIENNENNHMLKVPLNCMTNDYYLWKSMLISSDLTSQSKSNIFYSMEKLEEGQLEECFDEYGRFNFSFVADDNFFIGTYVVETHINQNKIKSNVFEIQ